METNNIDYMMDEALAKPVNPYTFEVEHIKEHVYVNVYDTRNNSTFPMVISMVMDPDWVEINVFKWSLETMIKRKLNKEQNHYFKLWINEIKAQEAVHNFKLNKEV